MRGAADPDAEPDDYGYPHDDEAPPARIDTWYKPAPVADIARTCRRCKAEGILHQDPAGDNCHRTVCGTCAGQANRIIVDRLNPGARKEQS